MTPRCEFKLSPRRTCGVELHGIWRYCPEHLGRPAALVSNDKAREAAKEYLDYYAADAELEDA
jgi:hypothetical protein